MFDSTNYDWGNLSEFFAMRWVEVLSALLTPTIAIFGILIAFRQWRLARQNFKERLFDRRFSLYNLATDLYLETRLGDSSGEKARELSAELGEKRRQAEFILDPEIAKSLENLHEACIAYRHSESMIGKSTNQAAQESLIDKNHSAQYTMDLEKNNLADMFSRYLKLGEDI